MTEQNPKENTWTAESLDFEASCEKLDTIGDMTTTSVSSLVGLIFAVMSVTIALTTAFTYVVVQDRSERLYDRISVLYKDSTPSPTTIVMPATPAVAPVEVEAATAPAPVSNVYITSGAPESAVGWQGVNPCQGKKPIHSGLDPENPDDNYFNNVDCLVEGVQQSLEQSGTNVTAGYKGNIDTTGRGPITTSYKEAGLCPVNVHYHLGTEHLSVGQYDTPYTELHHHKRKLQAATTEVRGGFQCGYYDAEDSKFTKEFDWQYCSNTHVGETYEVHWPHSAAGECVGSGTITKWQYQTPFYDGVFCNDGVISLSPLNTFEKIGVQAQVFTIVNDEDYYTPDLFKGMIVNAGKTQGSDMAYYTGSTTGTSRSNTICSRYTPITWQVDRKCHLISASSFDKMCADMMAQADDMSGDTHPHGSRELVADEFAADNHQK